MPDYCRKHHSHFCPCVEPELYSKLGELAEAMKKWDAAEENYRAKSDGERMKDDRSIGDEPHAEEAVA